MCSWDNELSTKLAWFCSPFTNVSFTSKIYIHIKAK